MLVFNYSLVFLRLYWVFKKYLKKNENGEKEEGKEENEDMEGEREWKVQRKGRNSPCRGIARNSRMPGKKTYLLRSKIGNTLTHEYSGKWHHCLFVYHGRMEKFLDQVTKWWSQSLPCPSERELPLTSVFIKSHIRENQAHGKSVID